MKTVDVKVLPDHLARLATSRSPIIAIAELIWNALDADATDVQVKFEQNAIGGIEKVRITDNGHGLAYSEVVPAFESLGGSWKINQLQTEGGRLLHGKQGKGRFQAFALGGSVEWITRYVDNGNILEYRIRGSRTNLSRFTIEDPEKATAISTGTITTISEISRSLTFLETPRAHQALAEEFALYLRQYNDVTIVYNGEQIDPSAIEDHAQDYSLKPIILEDGREIEANLTVVEWKVQTERALFLCDRSGFTLHRVAAGVHAPGFIFTAYLRSDLIQELWESGDIQLESLHPNLKLLVDEAKYKLREHFRQRASEKSGSLVRQWKEEQIYPYEGQPCNIVDEAERQVFDVLALNVNEYLPDFCETSKENRKLSFQLLKTALETSPEAVQAILSDVLNLPEDKQEEFAALLEKTSLEAIINASKIVADRLDFLQGLELLVFDPQGKKATLERRHLHKIVAEHTWLFGEQFNLTVSDRSLTNVLRKHLKLTQVEILDDKPVVKEDGSEGIVDLMLSRVVPQPRADEKEHVIIELKRPSVSIDSAAVTQIKDYATAIVKDERFSDTQTRWEFWVLSNEMSESVRLEVNQSGRPLGLLWHLEDYNLKIWAKTWGQIVEECKARLRFFQERLNYTADEESGLQYLQQVHAKYIPKVISERNCKE